MDYSYTQLEELRDRIKSEVAAVQNNLNTAMAQFAVISAACDTIASKYGGQGGFIRQVNALATANPTDPAVLALKASVDRMTADFQATKTAADALNTAVNS